MFYYLCGPDWLSPLNTSFGNCLIFHFSFLVKSHIICPKWLEGTMGFMHINTALLLKKDRMCLSTIYILSKLWVVYVTCTENNSLWAYHMVYTKLNDPLILISCPFILVEVIDTRRPKVNAKNARNGFQDHNGTIVWGNKIEQS